MKKFASALRARDLLARCMRTHTCSLPDVEIVGIADPLAEKAGPLAKETNSRVFADYDTLLAEGIDILNVCLPPALHLPAALARRAKGTHVLMEKPIAARSRKRTK